MPILVKDFTWTQSSSRICINLPLKGTKSTNLDILNSLEFCKISYPPFLFECWFNQQIKDEECLAIVKNRVISLQFNKSDEKIWTDLFHAEFTNKELLKQIREEAIVFAGERATRLKKQKDDDIVLNKKLALQQQMKLEEQERTHITQIKENEKTKVHQEMESFKKLSEIKAITNEPIIKEVRPIDNKSIFEGDNNDFGFEIIQPSDIEPDIAPRSNGTISFKFTPRIFPTPTRESQDQQEKEWLHNQAEARKFTQLPDELKDLTANETSLDWLKGKASEFYKQENYQAAIGVYNHAIKIFPKMAALYSNRAACHFKIRNLIKCVEDCTRALELLTPPVADNANSRLKAHVRRGSAFCELELYAEGLLDYEAALKIEPFNKEIMEDAENIRKLIVGTPPDFD